MNVLTVTKSYFFDLINLSNKSRILIVCNLSIIYTSINGYFTDPNI